MDDSCKRLGMVVRGLVVWVALAVTALAQDNDAGVRSTEPVPQTPCAGDHGECRQCGNVPQVNLALEPENWPAPCHDCDPCDPLRTCCPNKEDFFLVPPRPRLYIRSEGAAIRRDPTHSIDFASLGLLPTGTVSPTDVVLSTRDFEYDFAASGRLIIGHTFNECVQVEGIYFGVSEASDTVATRDNTPNTYGGLGNLFSPFGGFGSTPILGLDFNNFAQIHYKSSLQGAELNFRRKLPMPPEKLTTSILFGVRYFSLPEEFQYYTESDITKAGRVTANGSRNLINVRTTNDMVGPQIGALFEFYADNRWWVNVEMKAAVLNNRAHQSTTYTNTDNGIVSPPFTGTDHGDHTAFAEELSVEGTYRWTPHFTTLIGYRALWMQNVALAPDNLNTNIDTLTLGPAELNHRSATLYHGPYAGIVLAW
jgi:hypothetical protein